MVTSDDIKNTLICLDDASQSKLLNGTEEDLEKYWHFKYNQNKTISHNLYEFYKLIELYGSFCRRWEEAKHGSCCVVERVRDKYLMPKIKQFVIEILVEIRADKVEKG